MAAPNAELAYRVLDYVTAHPEQWNQKKWWCGTSGCFAGWTINLSGEEVDRFGIVYVGGALEHIANRAAQLLGFEDEDELTDATVAAAGLDDEYEDPPSLFASDNDREDLGRLVAGIFGPRPDGAK
jgi:hypothetical protein